MSKKKKKIHTPNPERAAKKAQRLQESLQFNASKRPFKEYASETQLVGLQYMLSSAVGAVTGDNDLSQVQLVSVLPGGVLATKFLDGNNTLVRRVALQATIPPTPDDLAANIAWALQGDEPEDLPRSAPSAPEHAAIAEALRAATVNVTVHSDFGWWTEGKTLEPLVQESINHASAMVQPTRTIEADILGAAWLVDLSDRAQIRWIIPEDEDELLLSMALCYAEGAFGVNEDFHLAGTARAGGLAIIVIDVATEASDSVDSYITTLSSKISDNLSAARSLSTLTSDQLRARDTLRSRQITL